MVNYHNRLCDLLFQESSFMSSVVNFNVDLQSSRKGYSFGGGDIDLFLKSSCGCYASVIEVKSNSAMRGKYVHDQLPKYKALFKNSPFQMSYYLVEGTTSKSLFLSDLVFTQFS
jgi:hypothetical protein